MSDVSQLNRQASPGIFRTLAAGFNQVTQHLWLTLLPVVLDVLYWLGPRLTARGVFTGRPELWRLPASAPAGMDHLLELGSQANLLTVLSMPLIGLPAFMSGLWPQRTPLAVPVYEMQSPSASALLVLGLGALGTILTVLYFSGVAWSLHREEERDVRATLRRLPALVARFVGLAVAAVVGFMVVMGPLGPVAIAFSATSPLLALGVVLLGLALVLGLFTLALPGIIWGGRRLGEAIVDSARLLYRRRGTAVALLLAILIIGNGTSVLWHLADDGSWLTLVSIFGHSFVWTGLLCALFIFYRDHAAELATMASTIKGSNGDHIARRIGRNEEA